MVWRVKAYGDGLVAQSAGKLLCDFNLACVVLLRDTKRCREQVVLGIRGQSGAHAIGVIGALGVNELLGKAFLLFTGHISGDLRDVVGKCGRCMIASVCIG